MIMIMMMMMVIMMMMMVVVMMMMAMMIMMMTMTDIPIGTKHRRLIAVCMEYSKELYYRAVCRHVQHHAEYIYMPVAWHCAVLIW